MHTFLTYLTQSSVGVVTRYGLVGGAIALVTLFRVLGLDAAPLLLYLPLVFLVSVALGRDPKDLATVLTAMCVAGFSVEPGGPWWQLTWPARPPRSRRTASLDA